MFKSTDAGLQAFISGLMGELRETHVIRSVFQKDFSGYRMENQMERGLTEDGAPVGYCLIQDRNNGGLG